MLLQWNLIYDRKITPHAMLEPGTARQQVSAEPTELPGHITDRRDIHVWYLGTRFSFLGKIFLKLAKYVTGHFGFIM